MTFKTIGTASAVALALLAPSIASATSAQAITDLNVRSGPSPEYGILGVIPGGESAELAGCLDAQSWCKVDFNGTSGWAYAPYLAVNVENEYYVVTERPASVEVSTVTYEDTAETVKNERRGAAAGATLGALAAYAAGGPVGGIVATGILGGAAGSLAAEPATETVTYVESNPVETVYLDGEVAVGAGVPQTVTTYEIPNAEYRYVMINDQTVLVDPSTNMIVRVLR